MAQVKAINANDYNNNGGTVLDSSSVVAIACGTKEQNTVPVESATSGTDQVNNSGTWAQLNQFIIKGGNITTALAGVTYTGAKYGNPVPQVANKAIVARRTIHITSWNYATGVATKGANTVDSFGADHAATPTRAVPGELVYMTGKKLPVADDYKPITGQ